jgi:hypothetical protein
MELDLYWHAVRWLALEHLHLSEDGTGIRADSLIVGNFDGSPLRLRYHVECDRDWSATAIDVHDLTSDERIVLTHQTHDAWRDASGAARSELADAIDVDIAATPFTNTLPLRRLRLQPGQAEEITAVYVAVAPSLSFRPVRQRYTRLPNDGSTHRYLYESLESGFKRELLVDPNGLVIDYPGIWQRDETV